MKQGKYIKTFKLLLPYLWPKKRNDLKTRVSFAVVALVMAKVASVSTPLVLGGAVNSLTELSTGVNLFMLVPVALIVAYGTARIIAFTFVAVRDALFSKVSQHSIRQISLSMFKHLHNLSSLGTVRGAHLPMPRGAGTTSPKRKVPPTWI